MGFFCFANAQNDSLKIKVDKLEKVNSEIKVLLKKADKVDKENISLIYKIKDYVSKLLNKAKVSEQRKDITIKANSQPQAIKARNINEPITEINIPDGVDSIRGGFFYRLFHKEKYYLRTYKILNDEKIYLD